MNQRGFWQLELVSDEDLQDELRRLLVVGARTEARIVAHLAEVDARKLHLAMGASSLFDYCLTRLELSNNEAFHRITAARLARRFPVIFGMLERRELHLTAVCLLRDHLTPDNHAELLAAATHKTKSQIEQLLARKFPGAAVPERLRKVQALFPLSGEQYQLQLTLSREAKEKLERARDLMSHANPSADLAVVIERALGVLLEQLEYRRFAQPKSLSGMAKAGRAGEPVSGMAKAGRAVEPVSGMAKAGRAVEPVSGMAKAGRAVEPVSATASAPSGAAALGSAAETARHRRALRRAVVREVVARDGRQCTFIGSDGQRCAARSHLQFHHDKPWALKGADTFDNVRLLCRAHNLLVTERELGKEVLAAKVAARRGESAA
jgi:hypothetical protein